MENCVHFRDRKLADLISDGLTKYVESMLKTGRYKYFKIFIRAYTDKELEQIENDYDPEEGPDYGVTSMYGNHIELVNTSINFDTLYSGAQVHLPNYKRAYLNRTPWEDSAFKKENCIIYYKDLKDIDFADEELHNFVAYSADEDFKDRFNKRNFDSAIKEYKELMKRERSQEEYLKKIKEDIKKFREGLSDEELLAINVLDV